MTRPSRAERQRYQVRTRVPGPPTATFWPVQGQQEAVPGLGDCAPLWTGLDGALFWGHLVTAASLVP